MSEHINSFLSTNTAQYFELNPGQLLNRFYRCYYAENNIFSNAEIHSTSASSSDSTLPNIHVFKIKRIHISFRLVVEGRTNAFYYYDYPCLFYIFKCPFDEETSLVGKTNVSKRDIPIYSRPNDIIFSDRVLCTYRTKLISGSSWRFHDFDYTIDKDVFVYSGYKIMACLVVGVPTNTTFVLHIEGSVEIFFDVN